MKLFVLEPEDYLIEFFLFQIVNLSVMIQFLSGILLC